MPAAPPAPPTRNQTDPLVPEERFWKKYSPHFEFPLSSVGSVALHVLVIGLFVIYLAKLLNNGPDRIPLPMRTVVMNPNDDGTGEAAPGSGGAPREAVKQEPGSPPQPNVPVKPLSKPAVRVNQWVPALKDDPAAQAVLADSKPLADLGKINDQIGRKIFEGLNGTNGKGKQPGSGTTDEPGGGTGGKGAETAKRSLRWTLSFNTRDGQDYLNQLRALKATLIIPQPPDYAKAFIIKDIGRPQEREPFNGNPDGQMFFLDASPESAAKVAAALGLDFSPPNFAALFPKEIENKLAELERKYRNRKESEIRSTTFKIFVRGGKYEIVVTGQEVIPRR